MDAGLHRYDGWNTLNSCNQFQVNILHTNEIHDQLAFYHISDSANDMPRSKLTVVYVFFVFFATQPGVAASINSQATSTDAGISLSQVFFSVAMPLCELQTLARSSANAAGELK